MTNRSNYEYATPERELWEILVPTVRNNGKPIHLRFHRIWDTMVRRITGGLTIRPPEKGQWVHPENGGLFAERMIPVKIACTEEQIIEICKMTVEYYDQEMVLAYRISDKVVFMRKDGTQV